MAFLAIAISLLAVIISVLSLLMSAKTADQMRTLDEFRRYRRGIR